MNTAIVAPPPVQPSPVKASSPGPSKVWYWVSAAVILVSALGALAIWLVGRYQVESTVKGYARFLAPGSAQLSFKRGGLYTLYYEYQGTIDGTTFDAPPMPPADIELEMFDEADQSLELRRIGREFRYDAGGFQGVSLRRVAVDRAGLYRINASAPAGAFAISVGRGDTPSTSSTDQAAWLVGIIGGAIGVIGLITTGVLRSRARARAAGALPGQTPVSGRDLPPSTAATMAAPAAMARSPFAPAEPTEPATAALEVAAPAIVEPELVPDDVPEPEPAAIEPALDEPRAAPSAFSATAPLAPAERTPEPASSVPPPPPPPPAASPVPAGGTTAAPGWGPPATGTASDPFEIRDAPLPPPPTPES